MTRRILFLTAILAGALLAQNSVLLPPLSGLDRTYQIPAVAIANLPTAAAGNVNQLYVVTDAAGKDSCVVAGGAVRVVCISDGSAWTPVAGAVVGAAPIDAHYLTTQAEDGLSAETVAGDSATKNVGTGAGDVAAGDHTHAATEITNTPAGDLEATTVQAAINELDTEKSATGHTHAYLPLAGGTMTGDIDLAARFIGSGVNPADAGVYRLSNNEQFCWEAATPGTDLCLYVGTDDEFHLEAPLNIGGAGGPILLTEAAVTEPAGAGTVYVGVETDHLIHVFANGQSDKTVAYTDSNITGTANGVAEVYDATNWDGDAGAAAKNDVRDKLEALAPSGVVASSALATAVKTRTFSCTFDGGGATLVDNSICYVRLPVAGTITGWSIVAVGTNPACTADVLKVASGTALPTASIAASALPALTGTDNAVKSTTLTGWTTAIAADDIAAIKITEPGAATWAQVMIYYTQN